MALSPFTCFFGAESFTIATAPVLLHGTSDAILESIWSDELDEFLPATQIRGRIAGGDHMGFVSYPTRPEGERDLEFAQVVSSAKDESSQTRRRDYVQENLHGFVDTPGIFRRPLPRKTSCLALQGPGRRGVPPSREDGIRQAFQITRFKLYPDISCDFG